MSTVGTNCQKELHRPPQSTASRDYMTSTTLINVTRIDTSSVSIYRLHCLQGNEQDDDDDVDTGL